MSHYLLNLARRSAGLAPMVRARVAPPAVLADSTADALGDGDTTRQGGIGAPVQTVVASHVPTASIASAIANVPAALPAALNVANTPAPVLQRAAVLPAISSTPSAQMAGASNAPPPEIRTASVPVVRSELPAMERHDTRVTSPGERTVVTRLVERVIEPSPPTIEPVPRVSVGATGEDARSAQPLEIQSDVQSPIEPRPSPISREQSAAVAVVIEPAPRAEPTPAIVILHNEAATPERTVNVRIGAIEIHSGESAQPSKAAAAVPALAVAAAQSPPPSGGFDDYTALRSYAPWTW